MWHLTACKISVSVLFLNWIKNEMIFYRIFELILATLIHTIYQYIKPFFDNKMPIFERYGTFKSYFFYYNRKVIRCIVFVFNP